MKVRSNPLLFSKNYFYFLCFFLFLGCSNSNIKKVERKYKKAEKLWVENSYIKAKTIFEQILKDYPDNKLYDDIVFKLGEIYYLNLHDDLKAINYFKILTDDDLESKNKSKSHKYLADIYENSMEDYDKAIIEYQRLIDISYDDIDDENQSRIAYCYFKKGNYYQAIVEFENIIEKYPKSKYVDYAYYQKSNIYYILGHCLKAREGFENILKKHPGSKYKKEAKLGIANCFDEEGKLEESLKIFKELKLEYNNKKMIDTKIEGLLRRISKKP